MKPKRGRPRGLKVFLALGILAVVALGLFVLQARDQLSTETERKSTSAEPSCPRWLSFVSTRSGRKQIYALDITHPSEVQKITRLTGQVFDPTWSPDGRRLAFRWFQPRDDAVGVYVADADGSNVNLLVEGGVTPNWSPDGRLIAHAGPKGISLVDVVRALNGDASASRALTRSDPTTPQEYPDWSSDGSQLLFAGYRRAEGGTSVGSYDIWIINADGTGLRDLTPYSSLEYGATWSPDGDQIVFGSLRGSSPDQGEDLFVIDTDGTDLRRLTTSGGNGAPAWSPDGRWIAFVSSREGNPDVYIMQPDGTGLRRLTTDPRGDYSPAWLGEC